MKRLIEKTVFCGFVTAWRLAIWPTSRSPSLVNATTEGVVRPPSAFGITTGSPPSSTATTELVVPRSMPMTLSAMSSSEVYGADGCQVGAGSARLARRRARSGPTIPATVTAGRRSVAPGR